jgi:hypothetical protein
VTALMARLERWLPEVGWWRSGVGVAVCKTVGDAFVGSNPTPATTSDTSPNPVCDQRRSPRSVALLIQLCPAVHRRCRVFVPETCLGLSARPAWGSVTEPLSNPTPGVDLRTRYGECPDRPEWLSLEMRSGRGEEL